jgi:hypothetical protein
MPSMRILTQMYAFTLTHNHVPFQPYSRPTADEHRNRNSTAFSTQTLVFWFTVPCSLVCSIPTFRKNLLSPSSGSQSKSLPTWKHQILYIAFHAHDTSLYFINYIASRCRVLPEMSLSRLLGNWTNYCYQSSSLDPIMCPHYITVRFTLILYFSILLH